MEETAQIENQQTQKIHQAVKGAGYKVKTVKPVTHETPAMISEVVDVSGQVIGDLGRETLGGTPVRDNASRNWIQILKERFRRRNGSNTK